MKRKGEKHHDEISVCDGDLGWSRLDVQSKGKTRAHLAKTTKLRLTKDHCLLSLVTF